MKKKLFKELLKSVKEMKRVMSGRQKPSRTTTYRTLPDGSTLRTVTVYDKETGTTRSETEHLY